MGTTLIIFSGVNAAETGTEMPIIRGHFAIKCYFEERGRLVTVMDLCFGDSAEKKKFILGLRYVIHRLYTLKKINF